MKVKNGQNELFHIFHISILNVIHNPHFDNDNSDFIKEYFDRGAYGSPYNPLPWDTPH